MARGDPEPGPGNGYLELHAALLASSFRRQTGRALAAPHLGGVELARFLYGATFVLVSHGVETDPVFNYANKSAQALFELDWAAFVRLESRHSAEPVDQAERAALMARVTRDGFIDDYAGIRISSSGRRFRIEAATVWNVVDVDDVLRGQAATFDRWVFL